MRGGSGRTTLARAILWFGASYGIALLGYLGLNAAAGRWLGPSDFGYFVAALTAAGVLANLGLVGSHRSGLREAARLRDDESAEALAELRTGIRAVALTTLPVTGALAGVGAWLLTAHLTTGQRAWFSVAVALLVVLGAHQRLWANYLRGFGYVRFASLLEGRSGGALVATLQAAMLVALWLWVPSWGVAGALSAVAAGYLLPIGLARWVVHRRWSHARVRSRLVHDLRRTIRRDWRFASVQVAVFLNSSVEIWIAALLLTGVETSMFTSALRLAMVLVLPMTSLQVVLSPVVARLAVGKKVEGTTDMERLLRSAATLALGLTVLIGAPMVLLPELILRSVYGPGFEAAKTALLLLSVGYMVNVLVGLAGVTLSMSGREGVAAKVHWAGAVLRALVGVPAAVYGGVAGLAVSTSVISAMIFVAMWVQTRRHTGVRTHVTVHPDVGLLRRTAG